VSVQTPAAFRFGDFLLDLSAGGLFRLDRDGKLVAITLGSRALDLLDVLVRRHGDLVSKQTIIEAVWAGIAVEEHNLTVQISALRRVLDEGRSEGSAIQTVQGRGYRFVVPVSHNDQSPRAPEAGDDRVRGEPEEAQIAAAARAALSPVPGTSCRLSAPRVPLEPAPAYNGNLPQLAHALIGRERDVAEIEALLPRHRLVTLVGAPGVGKTSLSLLVGADLMSRFPDGARLVELAPLDRTELVGEAVAAVFGLPVHGERPAADAIAALLRSRRVLLILDNCEHVIAAAARLADALLKTCPGVFLLATSREALSVAGEHAYPVPLLDVPPRSKSLTAAKAAGHSAVRLFVERAAAALGRFSLTEETTPIVAEICRRLDGIPLAIELAAPRLKVLKPEALLARLDDQLHLLTTGNRTAVPRQQTLRAAIEWSYALLSESEQAMLRRLGIFAGSFTLEAVVAVATGALVEEAEVFDVLAGLVDKSLVVSLVGVGENRYRLLESTRAFALEKLGASGDGAAMRRRHAECFRDVFARAEAGVAGRTKDEWLAAYGPDVDNLRAALDWAFSLDGDAALGVELTALAMDFWIALSLLRECCDWGLKAVASLGAEQATRTEMMLQSGLGKALTYSRGMQQDAEGVITRALTLAESLGEAEYQFRNTYALWLFALRVVDYRQCLSLSKALEALAEVMNDAWATAIANFAFGQIRYYLGEHAAAAAHLGHARAVYPRALRGGDPIRMGADLLTCSACYQAVTFWSLGLADKAYQTGREAIAEARSVNHAVSLCTALAAPSSILLVKMGYLEEAARCIDELIDQSEQHSLTPFYAFGLCSKGGLIAARGDAGEAERLLRLGLQRSRDVGYLLFDAFFQGELAAVLATAGRIDAGLAEIDAALAYAERSESLWCMPELLRIKGELLVKHDADAAETWFTRSCELATQQQALSWELRASMSLARLWHTRDRTSAARELIDNVYRRFTEGHGTADLREAANILK
jgi:non-specific serine/threonine protein kinase